MIGLVNRWLTLIVLVGLVGFSRISRVSRVSMASRFITVDTCRWENYGRQGQ
jgi:hypothetical protein